MYFKQMLSEVVQILHLTKVGHRWNYFVGIHYKASPLMHLLQKNFFALWLSYLVSFRLNIIKSQDEDLLFLFPYLIFLPLVSYYMCYTLKMKHSYDYDLTRKGAYTLSWKCDHNECVWFLEKFYCRLHFYFNQKLRIHWYPNKFHTRRNQC